MDSLERISQVFQSAEEIIFDDASKIVLMSDCHRGDGSSADDFYMNKNIYFTALTHYYDKNYTYIEIGDGDELWENDRFSDIINVHSDTFGLLSKFFNDNRLYLIFGNHDMVKSEDSFVRSNLYRYYNEIEQRYIPLFKGIKLHEGLILRYAVTDSKILLIHGHQVDFLNCQLWRLARFLVKYLWKPLEAIGINDPTSTVTNLKKREAVEKKLIQWVKREKLMLIAGHTHRPMFPEVGEPPYFNDGSLIYPRFITAIEIVFGHIRLVKWSEKTNNDGMLAIRRDVLAGPRKLTDYYT